MLTKAAIIAIITLQAPKYGIEPELALAVVEHESKFNVKATSPVGAIGLFQIMASSQPSYSKEQIRHPATNIKLGLKMLAEYKKSCVHRDRLNWLVCYNYGPANAKKVKYPEKFPYVKKISEILRRIKAEKERVVSTY